MLSKGEQTRRLILRVAVDRFGRDGYRATSVADIARDAGMSGTAAYAYFPSKEALFLAAADGDAADLIHEALDGVLADDGPLDWAQLLLVTLVGATERHPLARRLLAGLEPEVTVRVLDIPALAELHKATAARLAREQLAGSVRADADPASLAEGLVGLVLALLMSVVQLGPAAVEAYGAGIAAVLDAALSAPRGGGER